VAKSFILSEENQKEVDNAPILPKTVGYFKPP